MSAIIGCDTINNTLSQDKQRKRDMDIQILNSAISDVSVKFIGEFEGTEAVGLLLDQADDARKDGVSEFVPPRGLVEHVEQPSGSLDGDFLKIKDRRIKFSFSEDEAVLSFSYVYPKMDDDGLLMKDVCFSVRFVVRIDKKGLLLMNDLPLNSIVMLSLGSLRVPIQDFQRGPVKFRRSYAAKINKKNKNFEYEYVSNWNSPNDFNVRESIQEVERFEYQYQAAFRMVPNGSLGVAGGAGGTAGGGGGGAGGNGGVITSFKSSFNKGMSTSMSMDASISDVTSKALEVKYR